MEELTKYYLWAIVFVLFGCNGEPPPTDKEFIANFEKNFEIFEALKNKICKDGFYSVNRTSNSNPRDIPKKKLEDYYKLMDRIGVDMISKGVKCSVSLSVWSVGALGEGKYKGYIFNPIKKREIRSSLDYMPKNNKKSTSFHKKLTKGWFIYYYHWV